MDFRSGKELLELCREEGLPISEIMKRRETDSGLRTEEEMLREMEQVAEIMQAAVKKQLEKPERSLSGLIGGEGRKVLEFGSGKRSVCDSLMTRVIAYSMAVLEVNASMGLIVAAPTAGSSGRSSCGKGGEGADRGGSPAGTFLCGRCGLSSDEKCLCFRGRGGMPG